MIRLDSGDGVRIFWRFCQLVTPDSDSESDLRRCTAVLPCAAVPCSLLSWGNFYSTKLDAISCIPEQGPTRFTHHILPGCLSKSMEDASTLSSLLARWVSVLQERSRAFFNTSMVNAITVLYHGHPFSTATDGPWAEAYNAAGGQLDPTGKLPPGHLGSTTGSFNIPFGIRVHLSLPDPANTRPCAVIVQNHAACTGEIPLLLGCQGSVFNYGSWPLMTVSVCDSLRVEDGSRACLIDQS